MVQCKVFVLKNDTFEKGEHMFKLLHLKKAKVYVESSFFQNMYFTK